MGLGWDSYLCLLSGKPASFFVDLDLIDCAPIQGLTHLVWISLSMAKPRSDGLSSLDEFPTLSAIAHALDIAVEGQPGIVQAARLTTAGRQDYFFYVAQPDDWKQRCTLALSQFSQYKYDIFTAGVDEEWKEYFNVFYPRDDELEVIKNRRVGEALKSHGDALVAPRDIRHFVYFPTIESRADFVAEVQGDGFSILLSEMTKGRYLALVSRNDVPQQPEIDTVTRRLSCAAKARGGNYDGWETHVVLS